MATPWNFHVLVLHWQPGNEGNPGEWGREKEPPSFSSQEKEEQFSGGCSPSSGASAKQRGPPHSEERLQVGTGAVTSWEDGRASPAPAQGSGTH